PTNMTRASGLPSAKTSCVAVDFSAQPSKRSSITRSSSSEPALLAASRAAMAAASGEGGAATMALGGAGGDDEAAAELLVPPPHGAPASPSCGAEAVGTGEVVAAGVSAKRSTGSSLRSASTP